MKKKEKNSEFGMKTTWTEVTFTAKTISGLWKEIDNFVDSEKCRKLNCTYDNWGNYEAPSYKGKKWTFVMRMNIKSPA